MGLLRLRTSLAGSVGNLLEWYDFAVFGYFAPFMSAQFFPSDDPVSGLINTFGVFAVGYLARDYRDPALLDFGGLLVDGSLIWLMSALTTVKLTAATTTTEASLST